MRSRSVTLVLSIALAASSVGVAATVVTSGSCTPGYSPCIPNRASDVDCYGGGGNGPRYTRPGQVYRVTGYDRYRLDSDRDGKGCER